MASSCVAKGGVAGGAGAAHTFFSGESDKPRAGELINVLREAKQPVPEALLAFGTTVKKKESKLYGAHFKVLSCPPTWSPPHPPRCRSLQKLWLLYRPDYAKSVGGGKRMLRCTATS